MKALIKNKWFWILLAVAVVATFLIARSATGDAISSSTTKIIPMGGAADAAKAV